MNEIIKKQEELAVQKAENHINKKMIQNSDPFQNKSNINELERRISDIRSGKSTLKEHDLIDLD